MHKYNSTTTLDFSSNQLYNIVIDVESYPLFLPWCLSSKIISKVDKNNFDALMKKSSQDMIKLTSEIETTDNIKGTIGKLMWSNCKACHSKYRKEH